MLIKTVRHFIDGGRISFDTETTGLNVWHGDKPFAFSFCNEGGETAYFEFPVNPHTREVIPDPRVLGRIAALLGDPRIVKVFHNRKFDQRMMDKGWGIRTEGETHDTMIMAFVCNTLERSLGLKQLTKKYGAYPDDDQDLLQKLTKRLRNKAAKKGWNIAFDYQEQPDAMPKRKAAVAADYWLPQAMWKVRKDLLTEQEAGYCELYARGDAERTTMLDLFYTPVIEELNLQKTYKMEQDIFPVLYRMEDRGAATDLPSLDRSMETALVDMRKIYARIERAAWPGFRPKNDGDVRKLFYEKLKFPVTELTKGGKHGTNRKPSVNKFVIKSHLKVPVVLDIAVWKANRTAYTTFFAKFKKLSAPDPLVKGGTVVHCDFRQVGPRTGRFASRAPNLQNVLAPDNSSAVHPMHVRPAFIARPDMRWLCVDYEGMEIRVFADVSQEPFMMEAIRAGRSVHDEMTNLIWGGPNNEEALKQAVHVLSLDGTGIHSSKEVDALWCEWDISEKDIPRMSIAQKYELADAWLKRFDYNQVEAQNSIDKKTSKSMIKGLSFLKIYGGGARKASILLDCEVREAKRILRMYDRLFPGVDGYAERLKAEARQNGYITTMWGRRLEVDPDKVYKCVNYMVQGSSADLLKQSMIECDRFLRGNGLDAHVLLTVHDELIFEIHKTVLSQKLVRDLCRIMADPMGHLSIDMPVEPRIAPENWGDKRKVKFDWTSAKAA